ncbi:hypothetical protein B0H13DRAFT_1903537 [Mycena leptocephala]|nr:hypothetical protein B0H13DRAFT_1903537 [Mycena leptocephala]
MFVSGPEINASCLSGSSAVNGALFTHPNKIDLNLWESAFCAAGWLRTFRRPQVSRAFCHSMEQAEQYSTRSKLPLEISGSKESFSQFSPPVGRKALTRMAATQEEFGIHPKAMFSNSTRSSSANCYYFAQPGGPIQTGNKDGRIAIAKIYLIYHLVVADQPHANLQGKSKNGKAVATGVEYTSTSMLPERNSPLSQCKRTHCQRGDRVILSARIFGTPQVLELSGVGNSNIINPLGISAVVNLPAVVESPRTLLNSTEWRTAYTLLQTAPPGLGDAAHKALYVI